MKVNWRLALLLFIGAFVASSVPLAGQPAARRSLTLGAGPSPYDLAGTGTGFAAYARVDHRVLQPVFVEWGLGYFSYGSRFDPTVRLLMPEASVQAGPSFGPVRPYVGTGLGYAARLSGPTESDFTAHVALGARIRATREWGTRGELRVRAVDPWVGSTADFTIGISRTL